MNRLWDFYTDGVFNREEAKDAYYELMRYHHIPISGRLETEDFWVSDFDQHDFGKIGIGGITWVNDRKNNYFGHDIFLLPGQMLVEHKHASMKNDSKRMKSWHLRNGSAYLFHEGEPKGQCPIEIPVSQQDSIHAKAWTQLTPGNVAHLEEVGSWHFIVAGRHGTIITEYATANYDDDLEFSNRHVVF